MAWVAAMREAGDKPQPLSGGWHLEMPHALPSGPAWLVRGSWTTSPCPPLPCLPLYPRPGTPCLPGLDPPLAAPGTPRAVSLTPCDHRNHSWSRSVLEGPVGRVGLRKRRGRKGRGEMTTGCSARSWKARKTAGRGPSLRCCISPQGPS